MDEYLGENHDRLVRICLKIVDNVEDAKDLSQEVYFKISKNIDSFKGDSKIETWIYMIVLNTYRNNVRLDKKNKFKHVEVSVVEKNSEYPTPEEELLFKQFEECVDRQISKLNEIYQFIIERLVSENISNEDLANELGMSKATAAVTKNRARERLRVLWELNCK